MNSASVINEEDVPVKNIETIIETDENIEINENIITEEKSIKKPRVKKAKSIE